MVDLSISTSELEYFLLIFIRMTAFLHLAPFYGEQSIPSRVKVTLGLFLAYLVYTISEPVAPVYDTVTEYAILVIQEATVGLLIGLAAMICMQIVSFAGHIIDMETGLSMVTLMDPTTKESTSVSGVFYQYMIMLLLIISGMHEYLLKALADTFILIPINGAVFDTASLMETMVRFMSEYIIIGFRICLPIFAVMIMLNAILGILAKVSQQLNMFAVGIQIKILVGLGVLFLTVSMLPTAADFIFTQMKKIVVSFVEGMM